MIARPARSLRFVRGFAATFVAAFTLLVNSLVASAADEISSPEDDVKKIIAVGREDNQAMSHLDYLVNRIGPRLTSSDGLTNACNWTRETFESWGMSNPHLEKWAEWPVGFNRGPRFGKMVAPEEISLEFATDSWTPGTKGIERGLVIKAPRNEEQLAVVKDQLAGKWVLNPPAPPARRGGAAGRGRGRGRGGDGAAAGGERGNAANAAAGNAATGETPAQPGQAPITERQTAAAAGQQPEGGRGDGARGEGARGEGARGDQQAGARGARRGGGGGGGRGNVDPFQRKLRDLYEEVGVLGTVSGTGNDLVVTGGTRPPSLDFFDKMPSVAAIKMTDESYNKVAKRVNDGDVVMLEFDIRNYFKRGPVPIYNVIADIPGTEHPDEYVIVGGHLDSWDAATGTTDNGTGIATTMEAARILMKAGVKPKRTIRFMLWTGEEQGLLGSKAYVEANPELIPKISAVLVHDAGTQFISGIRGLASQMDDLKKIFAPMINLDPNFPFEVEVTAALPTGGSDHSSFIRAGAPGFFWQQAGELARYRDTHHTQFDTYDRAVPDYQKHSSIVVALAAYRIANLDHLLAKPETE